MTRGICGVSYGVCDGSKLSCMIHVFIYLLKLSVNILFI